MILELAACLSIAVAHQSNFETMQKAHQEMEQVAVRVTAWAKSGEQETGRTYTLWKSSPSKFRLATTSRFGDVDLLVNDSSLVVLHRGFGQYMARRVTGQMIAGIEATLQETDAFWPVFVNEQDGLKAFTLLFGPVEFKDGDDEPGMISARATFSQRSQEHTVELVASASDHRIREAAIYDGDEASARWRFEYIDSEVIGYADLEVPEDSTRVRFFSESRADWTFESEQAAHVFNACRDAQVSLESVYFSSTAYMFSDTTSQTRYANIWWERDGHLRFGITVNRPEKSFAALFDGEILTGWDRTAGQLYAGAVPRNEVTGVLNRALFEFEPLLLSLIDRTDILGRNISPGSEISMMDEQAVIGRQVCTVLVAKYGDTRETKIYVRAVDGLIARIERQMRADGKTVLSETLLYDYHIVNKDIPTTAWQLGHPKSLRVSTWPGR